jgi:hypothetical protein
LPFRIIMMTADFSKSSQNTEKTTPCFDWTRRSARGIPFAKLSIASNGLDARGLPRGRGAFFECSRRSYVVTVLDVASLAAALSLRIRRSSAGIIMERSALLRTMTAIDDVEQSWQADLARISRRHDLGPLYALLEEMLTGDVLLRTWTAFVASSVDSGRRPLHPQSAASLLTRMLLRQRRRLLTTVIDSRLDFESLQQLDVHRRSCERWSDVLLSVFPATSSTRALKFDHERSTDFAQLWPAPGICSTRAADPVVVTAMKSALAPLALTESPRKLAWSQLGESIQATLRHDGRTLWGVTRSLD